MADGTLTAFPESSFGHGPHGPGFWDAHFLGMARYAATASKDPSTKVGCVLVNELRQVIGMGYNGFPRGVIDCPDRLADRETKYLMVQHAEANAVMQSVASTRSSTAYVTHHPCANCAGILIQAGVTRVVTLMPDQGIAERFKASFVAAKVMLLEASVPLAFLDI